MTTFIRWLVLCTFALIGCKSLPPAVAAVDNVLGVLCETRSELHEARAELERGDLRAAAVRLREYLKRRHTELGALKPEASRASVLPTLDEVKLADPEVGAALTLLDAELARTGDPLPADTPNEEVGF